MSEMEKKNLIDNDQISLDQINLNDELSKSISLRLRRIEGQVKGIEKMVSSNACCKDILVQVAAVRSAMNKVGGLILENYTKKCLMPTYEEGDNNKAQDENIEQLISTFLMFLK